MKPKAVRDERMKVGKMQAQNVVVALTVAGLVERRLRHRHHMLRHLDRLVDLPHFQDMHLPTPATTPVLKYGFPPESSSS